MYEGGHAPFPFTCSVQDLNVHKIAAAGGSTGYIAVTTPCTNQYIYSRPSYIQASTIQRLGLSGLHAHATMLCNVLLQGILVT